MSEVLDRVRDLLVEQLGVDEGEVVPDASIVDDLGADSLDHVEIVMALEAEFELEIPDDDVEGIASPRPFRDAKVSDLVAYIARRKGAPS